jgi:hypothetical protein
MEGLLGNPKEKNNSGLQALVPAGQHCPCAQHCKSTTLSRVAPYISVYYKRLSSYGQKVANPLGGTL